MSFSLLEDEWSMVRNVPLDDLVELAATLDIVIPANADRRALIEACVPRMVARARAEGLPFSKYDREDLQSLGASRLAVVGRLLGLSGPATVDAVLKAGRKVTRTLERSRPGHDPYVYMLPLLLKPVLRCAEEGAA